jgi:GT2 family glycosyltransferase
MTLAVVIVTWNVRTLVLDALRSLYDDLDTSGLDAQVIVVDNASTDGTAQAVVDAFPRTRLIAAGDNIGFVRANNLALRALGFGGQGDDSPDAVYLLNPDTITQPGTTRILYDTLMADKTVGLVGARLTYGDGSFQHSAFAFPGLCQLWVEFMPTPGRFVEGRFNGRYPRALYAGRDPFPVDFVLGATMMLRREVVERTGLFDEAFFMYCEEIDWAWRIHDAGWRVLCVPAAHVVHLGGQSTAQARAASIIHLWRSRLRLYRKHLPRWKVLLARGLIAIGMRRRMRQARELPESERARILHAYETVYRMAIRR